jgi:uncharacterized protein YodC (DUF2158 family)
MSVRATGALIGDVVRVSELSNSPKMIVTAVDTETKLVTTAWFSGNGEAQQSAFPASALDRVEAKPVSAPAKKTASAMKTGSRKK